MRIRLPIGRTLFFLGAFFLSMLALIPMRVAVDGLGLADRGFAARYAVGTIWFGGFREAQMGRLGLGDLDAGLHAMPLLTGRARIALNRPEGSPGDQFRGAAVLSGGAFGFADVNGKLMLAPGALGRLPLGQIELTDLNVRFEGGQCAEAAGNVRAMLSGDIGGVSLPGGMSGTARCDAGALLIALVSQSSMEAVDLRVTGDGRYTANVRVRSADAAARERMAAAGLTPTADGYGATISGEF